MGRKPKPVVSVQYITTRQEIEQMFEIAKNNQMVDDKNTLKALKILYKKEKNPMYAWRAYHLTRKWSKTIPKWVLEYLDESSQRLIHENRSGRESDKVSDNFGFTPRSIEDYQKTMKEVYVYSKIRHIMIQHQVNNGKAIAIKDAIDEYIYSEQITAKMHDQKARDSDDITRINKAMEKYNTGEKRPGLDSGTIRNIFYSVQSKLGISEPQAEKIEINTTFILS